MRKVLPAPIRSVFIPTTATAAFASQLSSLVRFPLWRRRPPPTSSMARRPTLLPPRLLVARAMVLSLFGHVEPAPKDWRTPSSASPRLSSWTPRLTKSTSAPYVICSAPHHEPLIFSSLPPWLEKMLNWIFYLTFWFCLVSVGLLLILPELI
jgi:hypothetical protein